ncbi:MAG: AbgT family transporter [Phycisphaeraceae bacterium]|nr:AbgT family transporter [Phycisphaeraceae bacterium]
MRDQATSQASGGAMAGFLNLIERLGNKLPEPVMLFVAGAAIVMIVSHIGAMAGWSVEPVRLQQVTQAVVDASGNPVMDPQTGAPMMEPVIDPATGRVQTMLVKAGEPLRPYSLLTPDGLYWCISGLVRNFINFPPLGIVLTGMLGVGVAEKTGLFDALLKALARAVPRSLITPTVLFLGITSNVASDAGYIVLPPLAAALFMAAGRSPLAGIATAFAGVSAGFGANLLIGGTDALMAGITQPNAQILDSDYSVTATSNWTFMVASTFLLTFVGWGVTAWLVEPRLKNRPLEEGGALGLKVAQGTDEGMLNATEWRGLRWAGIAFSLALAVVLLAVLIPGWPLHGNGPEPTNPARESSRWVNSVVPLVMILFLVPGLAYGVATDRIQSQKDAINAMVDAMRAMAPIIVMSFVAAQFIAFFNHSNLGRMLAITGGVALAESSLHPKIVIVMFMFVTMGLNLLVSSMSAKYLLMAPIFVPMLMMMGISPELTQVSYRIADSVTNVITPMNSYMIIILATTQRFAKSAGMGTMISMMLPYSVVFGIIWIAFLLVWMWFGFSLGFPGPIWYTPAN